jgi:hypothetical protein
MLLSKNCQCNEERTLLRRVFFFAFVAIAILFSVSSVARTKDPPWVAKDWTQWSSRDCQNVLQSSPWGQWNQGGTSIRLESALPIREAHLRELQLLKHYDRMNPKKKKAFDEEHAQDLSEGNGGQVVIWWSGVYRTSASMGEARESWPAMQTALRLLDGSLVMPIKTTLSGGLTEYEVHIGGGLGKEFHVASIAEYVFPRTVNGKPLYTEHDKMIIVSFGDVLPYKGKTEILGPQRPEGFSPDRQRYGFEIPKLMYKGKLEY